MSTNRARRLPISCDPCRIRKIRCPRDATPCGTCRRRGITAGSCQYARGPLASRQISLPTPFAPPSPLTESTSQVSNRTHDSELATRVQKIEQLLQSTLSSRSLEINVPTNQRLDHQNNTYTDQAGPPRPPFEKLHGRLRTSEAGHLLFVPQALSWDPGLQAADEETQRYDRVSDLSQPLGASRIASVEDLLAALPPQKACQELVNVYFSSFASLFHILHDPTFHQQYEYFVEDPQSMPLAWLGLLYALLATAVLALPPDSELLSDLSRRRNALERSVELTQRFRNMSMRCLEADNYLWDHNVTTLQALVILIYGLGHSHGQTWTLLGLAHHLALSIGCHVDPEELALDTIESEERRRVWAGLMMLYASQNAGLGHVGLPHTSFHASSKPPADADDDQIQNNSQLPSGPSNRATQMTYLLLKFRLYNMCSEIYTVVLCKDRPNFADIQRIDQILREERFAWQSRLNEAIATSPLPTHHIAHLNILYSYSNHLTLLLHQRQALDPQLTASAKQVATTRCVESAQHLLEVHATLNEAPDLTPFRWYGRGLGSFHAFHAAALLTAMIRLDYFREDRVFYVNLLRKCSISFDSLAEFSIVCAKAAPILRSLLLVLHNQSSYDLPQDRSHNIQPLDNDYDKLPQQYPQPVLLPQQQEGAYSDMDFFLSHIPPQNWMSPASLPWSDWSYSLNNTGISEGVVTMSS